MRKHKVQALVEEGQRFDWATSQLPSRLSGFRIKRGVGGLQMNGPFREYESTEIPGLLLLVSPRQHGGRNVIVCTFTMIDLDEEVSASFCQSVASEVAGVPVGELVCWLVCVSTDEIVMAVPVEQGVEHTILSPELQTVSSGTSR